MTSSPITGGYPNVTIECPFCGTVYQYDAEDLAGWIFPDLHDLHQSGQS